MSNKRESGLVEAMSLETESLPRLGDRFLYRNVEYKIVFEAEVYEISRNIARLNKEGVFDIKGERVEHLEPIIRALVIRGKHNLRKDGCGIGC